MLLINRDQTWGQPRLFAALMIGSNGGNVHVCNIGRFSGDSVKKKSKSLIVSLLTHPRPACMPSTRSQSRSNTSKPPLPKPIKKPKCTTIIDRGKSRGEPCGRDATYGLYCTRHKKCPRTVEDGEPCRQNRKMYDVCLDHLEEFQPGGTDVPIKFESQWYHFALGSVLNIS
jgi:hypothetical protein